MKFFFVHTDSNHAAAEVRSASCCRSKVACNVSSRASGLTLLADLFIRYLDVELPLLRIRGASSGGSGQAAAPDLGLVVVHQRNFRRGRLAATMLFQWDGFCCTIDDRLENPLDRTGDVAPAAFHSSAESLG